MRPYTKPRSYSVLWYLSQKKSTHPSTLLDTDVIICNRLKNPALTFSQSCSSWARTPRPSPTRKALVGWMAAQWPPPCRAPPAFQPPSPPLRPQCSAPPLGHHDFLSRHLIAQALADTWILDFSAGSAPGSWTWEGKEAAKVLKLRVTQTHPLPLTEFLGEQSWGIQCTPEFASLHGTSLHGAPQAVPGSLPPMVLRDGLISWE